MWKMNSNVFCFTQGNSPGTAGEASAEKKPQPANQTKQTNKQKNPPDFVLSLYSNKQG